MKIIEGNNLREKIRKEKKKIREDMRNI